MEPIVSDLLNIVNSVVGGAGLIVGIIGCKCLAKANKLSAREIHNSSINQAETLIVQNGLDNYAVIKLAQDTTKEELKTMVENLNATMMRLEDMKTQIEELEARPKIVVGKEPPADLRNHDLYIEIED